MVGLKLLIKYGMLLMIFATTLIVCLLLKSPYNRPQVALYQDQPLLNLTNFHYLISPDACHPEEEVKALMVITSHTGHIAGRMAWRNAIPTQVCIFSLSENIIYLKFVFKIHIGHTLPANDVKKNLEQKMLS